MPDRHLRRLREAARTAAHRAREHRGDAEAMSQGSAARREELRRLAQRARKRLDAGARRRAAPRGPSGGADGS